MSSKSNVCNLACFRCYITRPPSGRRSRVSRRQIIQATWLGYNSSSSDESMTNNDLDENDNTIGIPKPNANLAPTKPPRRRSPSSRHHKSKHNKDAEKDREESGNSPQGASNDMMSTSSSSLPMIQVESPDNSISNNDSLNLVTSVEDFLESDQKEGTIVELKTPIQLHLRSSPNTTMEGILQAGGAVALPPYAMFGRTDTLDILEKDTLDSYISTMTDDTDTNAYTFADPFDDTHSVASTSYESRFVLKIINLCFFLFAQSLSDGSLVNLSSSIMYKVQNEKMLALHCGVHTF